MNKYKKALDRMDKNCDNYIENYIENCNSVYTFSELEEDNLTLQELIDKDIPMKIRSVKTISKCCTKAIYLSNYCSICGQRLNWEE